MTMNAAFVISKRSRVFTGQHHYTRLIKPDTYPWTKPTPPSTLQHTATHCNTPHNETLNLKADTHPWTKQTPQPPTLIPKLCAHLCTKENPDP